ncbi:hypothetical protein IWQ51_001502 [Labrenzia sp. EL_142]|nr:hypothetical protein [Labrenzia sp. EL_142]
MPKSSFLTDLLDDGDVGRFIAEDWGKAMRHWPAGLNRLACGSLTVGSFETAIAALNRAHEGWLHFAHQGLQAIPPDYVDEAGQLKMQKIAEAFAAGRTLYLTKAECIIAPLSQMCLALHEDLANANIAVREKLNAHVFLTPRNAQGFAPHRDAHASFILQCEGQKNWTVYVPRHPAKEVYHPGATGPDELAAHEAVEIMLEEGDILYMPEWWPHEASASRTHSLHVTLRIFPLRFSDVMSNIVQRSVALADPVGPEALRDLHTAVTALIAGDAFRTELPETLASALAQTTRLPERERQSGLLDRVVKAEDICLDTVLKRNMDMTCYLRETPQNAALFFADTHVSGPLLFRPVFEFVSGATEFRPSDLPEINAQYDRLDVSRRLLRGGLVHAVL